MSCEPVDCPDTSPAFPIGPAQRRLIVRVNFGMRVLTPAFVSPAARFQRALHFRRFIGKPERPFAVLAYAFLGVLLLVGAASAAAVEPVAVNWVGAKPPPFNSGVSWGVPWPQGVVRKEQSFSLAAADGRALPLQSWPLAYWPDGSVKWSGFATVVNDAAAPFTLAPGEASTAGQFTVSVHEVEHGYEIDTGRLVCRIVSGTDALVDSLRIDGRLVAANGRLVCVRQDGPDNDDDVAPRRERYVGRVDKITVEQAGPVRAVLKLEGKHISPARAWLPFVVRLYFYAGQLPVRMVHTIVYDGDQEKDFIHGLGLTFDVPLREQVQNRHVRFAGADGGLWAEPIQPGGGNPAQQAGQPLANRPPADPNKPEVAVWSDYKLTQLSPDGFTIAKRTNPKSTWVFANAGHRAAGFVFAGDISGGLGVSVKNFWQSYPSSLEVRDAAAQQAQVTAWLWSPDGPAMDMRHYDIRAHGLNESYEDVQPGLSTAFGVARTSELTLYPATGIPTKAVTVELAQAGAERQLLAAAPQYLHSTGVFGVWSLPDRSTPLKTAVEDRLDALLAYYQQQVDERYWYGFWYYGDFIHSYNRAAHTWYYDWGGHAWDNTELGVPLWLWYSFLRTGRADVFHLAEALTRNTSETCVYHLGPMAGLGSRHNVIKWGDGAKEARISQAAHWRPFYYLTTDERTGDIMHEMVHSDEAAIRYDPMREAQPPLPQDPKYPGRIRIGPDWFALAGNWMTEWERTGDPRWRDRILVGVDSILAMPYWIRSGVRNGLNPDIPGGKIGPLKGGGSMTVGYDPATARLLPIPDPIEHTQVPVNYNLSTIQGGAEVMFELVPLLGRPDWAKAWLQYCRLGEAPAEVLKRDRVTGNEGANAEFVEQAQGGPRLAGYAYAQTRNPAFAKVAVQGLSRRGGVPKPQLVKPPEVLNPVHEAAFVSTNDSSQWSLSAIEILALCADVLPNELPPPPPFPGFRGSAPGNAGGAPTGTPSTANSRPPDNPASSPTAEPVPEQ